MRWIIGIHLLTVGAMLGVQAPMQAQAADPDLPVSMERIRAALKEPAPRLRMPGPSGDRPLFHVEVQERMPVLQPVEESPFDPTYGLPSVGELLMNGVEKIRSSVVEHKRSRAQRRARKEVEDGLAEFCATHGCSTPTTTPPRSGGA